MFAGDDDDDDDDDAGGNDTRPGLFEDPQGFWDSRTDEEKPVVIGVGVLFILLVLTLLKFVFAKGRRGKK
jgi:hypothetical protein